MSRNTLVAALRFEESANDGPPRSSTKQIAAASPSRPRKPAPPIRGARIDHSTLLDSSSIGSSIGSSHAESFIDRLTDQILRVVSRDIPVSRLSLTTAHGRETKVRAAMVAVSARCAEYGDHRGALLVRDVRTNGDDHAYGIALATVEERSELVGAWRDITGGQRAGQRVQAVSGWHRYHDSGGVSQLAVNLRHVLEYAVKPLAHGMARDWDCDVAVSGALGGAWESLRADAPVMDQCSTTKRPRPMGQTVTACVACGKSLAGRHRQTRTCSTRCRVAMWRRAR